MNEVRGSRSLWRAIVLLVMVYALNLSLIALDYWGVNTIETTVPLLGMSRPEISHEFREALVGFVLGEVACLALWVNVSNRKLRNKILVYLFATSQLAFLCVVCFESGPASSFFIFVFGASIAILVLTSVAVRIAAGRARLLPTSNATEGRTYVGFSIAQLVFFTAVVAITLFAVASKKTSFGSNWESIVQIVWLGFGVGLLPVLGLIIATSFRRLVIQISACILLAALACVLLSEESRSNWSMFALGVFIMIWIVLLPVVWIRILHRMGYVIRFFDREPVAIADNPWKAESEGGSA